MIRDITIGQYYPVDSFVHRLDPRVKLMATLVFVVTMFLFKSFVGYILIGAFIFTAVKVSHVPVKYMMKGLKAIWVILAFTLVFNLFLTDGTPIVSFWKITITYEGVRFAIFMALRLFLLVIGTSLMTLTTTPNQLTDGMEVGLRWMKKIHIPVHEIAMMMSIALRFIPILMEETDKIMKAQQARGADFEEGKLHERVKALIPIFIPLFVSAFRRANDLAMAMEARGYRGDQGRTRMKPLKYHRNDYLTYLGMILFIVLLITTDKLVMEYLVPLMNLPYQI